jgi:superfamily I DNA/RNA helicase
MVKGLAGIKSSLKGVPNPDAILCRTNAGVISALMGEQAKGRSVSIIGRTQELIDFAEACQQLMAGRRTGHPELAPFSNWESFLGFIAEYPDEAQEIKTMVELIQSFGTGKLISALNQVVPEKQADVVVSTAHRAKGREWNDVRLQGDFLHVDDMDSEDLRLAYVAITRAQKTLDMTSWDTIIPLEKQKRFTYEPTVTHRSRPPIVVESELKQQDKKGIASRLNPWK